MGNTNKSAQALIRELEAKGKEISLLKKKSADYSEQLKRLEYRLDERLKELRCHTQISEILSSSGLSKDESIEMIVESIPQAMQFPLIARASISLGEKVYKTKGFRKTKISLARQITLFGKLVGFVVVCYPELKHSDINIDFLPEEGDLLFSIAVRIGHLLERTEREYELESSENKYRDLINGMNDTVWVIDFDTTILDVNNTAVTALGYSKEELLSMKIPEIDTSLLPEQIRDLAVNMRKDEVQVFETSHRTKDGRQIPVEISSSLVSYSGKEVIMSIARDISKRKQMEHKLRESEIRYHELFNNIKSGVAIYEVKDKGKDYIFRDFNRAAEFIDGDFKKDIIGKSIYEARPGIKKFGLLDVFKRVYNTGIPEHYLEKFYSDEKRQSWYDNYIYKLPSGELVAVFDDISEMKIAEEALLLEKENFRRSLDDSPLGKRITTLEGDTIYANRALLQIYGYDSIEELQRTHLKERYTQESYSQSQERKQKRIKGDFSDTDYQISIVRKDKQIRHLQVWRKEILWDGAIQFQVIYNDITERKQALERLQESEKRFSSIFHINPIGIVLTQMEDGLILNANDTFLRLFGFHREDVIGHTTLELKLYPDPVERIRLINKMKEKGSLHKEEVKFLNKTGETGTVLLSAGIIEQHGKKNLLSMLIDITDRKRAEEEILRSRKSLENLNRRLNDIREEERKFISRELHDQLGQSLTALKIDLNGLHKHIKTDPEALKTLDNIVGMVSESIREVQQISSELRPEILYDLGLVSAVEWYIENFEKRTGIKCHLQNDESGFADPEKNLGLFRILQEALTNVMRHTIAADVWISLCQDKDAIVMSIKDNGAGIPKDKIWSSESLGIIGMRERAKQFGGTVDISSKKNIGTTISITLP